MNILIVEDNKVISIMVSKIVSEMDYQYYLAQDGETALTMFKERQVDLVLMDVEMPGDLNGLETTRRIRELSGDNWIPIIFVSSYSSEEEIIAGIEAGGDDFISKPVNAAILKARIQAFSRILAKMPKRETGLLTPQIQGQDILTGTDFERFYGREWSRLSREKQPISVIHSRVIGEEKYTTSAVEKELTRIISTSIFRPADFAASINKEEYILVLPNTELSGARKVSQRIQQAAMENNSGSIKLSIGVSSIQLPSKKPKEELLASAEEAMVNAIKKGRESCFQDISDQ